MTLIELLIAMTVMAIGIAALVAGFGSGLVTINRARVTSTAGALADKQMELYRQSAAAIPTTSQTFTPPGSNYTLQVVPDAHYCAIGTYSAGACSGTPASRPMTRVTITVLDGSRVLFAEDGTFASSTG